jgi:hypothetical protein
MLKSNLACFGSLALLGFFSWLNTITESSFIKIMAIVPIFTHCIGYNLGLAPVVWVRIFFIL